METHLLKGPPGLGPNNSFRAVPTKVRTGGEYAAPLFELQDFILLI
jgi:hypothetical protein